METKQWIVIGSILVLLLLIVIVTSPSSLPQDTQKTHTSVGIGHHGILQQGDYERTPVCKTNEYWNELMDTLIVNDKIGTNQILTNGKCYMAYSGVKVLILDKKFSGSSQFRFLEGNHYGDVAWTDSEYIIK